jgi:predicted transcriptional regulator
LSISVSFITLWVMAARPRQRKGPRGKTAEALRAWRQRLGITQVEAARLLGVSRPWVARVESGSIRPRPLLLAGLLARMREIEETAR